MTYSAANAVILSRIAMFEVLAGELHFGRTAKTLGISQSALSEQIRKLEGDLDVVLFERDTRNVRLTDAGTQLIEPARSLLEQAERFRNHAELAAAQEGSVLRLAYVASSATTMMTKIIELLVAADDLSIDTHMMHSPEMMASLQNGVVDVGLTFDIQEQRDSDAEWIHLLTDQCHVNFGPRHPYASKSSITVDELVASPIAIGPDLAGDRSIELENRFAAAGRTIQIAHRSTTMNDHILHLLTSPNIGLATEIIAKVSLAGGLLSVPIATPFPVRWGFTYVNPIHPRVEQILRDVSAKFRDQLPAST